MLCLEFCFCIVVPGVTFGGRGNEYIPTEQTEKMAGNCTCFEG